MMHSVLGEKTEFSEDPCYTLIEYVDLRCDSSSILLGHIQPD